MNYIKSFKAIAVVSAVVALNATTALAEPVTNINGSFRSDTTIAGDAMLSNSLGNQEAIVTIGSVDNHAGKTNVNGSFSVDTTILGDTGASNSMGVNKGQLKIGSISNGR